MRSFPGISCEINDEEKLLLSHIDDMRKSCERDYSPKFSRFLDERQAMLAEMLLRGSGFGTYRFFGGCEGAVRKMLCVYPEYCEPEDGDFPIKTLLFGYRRQDKPTHSQFLGTIMSCMIERSMVGDIVVDEGRTWVFVCDNAADAVSMIEKVGHVGVKVSFAEGADVEIKTEFEEFTASVSSLRLDCVASAAIKLSRDKTTAFIRSEGIDVNHRKIYAPDFNLSEGDVFSVRGRGKFVLDSIGGRSRRDRLFVTLKKYK